jgi:hypothetical protein
MMRISKLTGLAVAGAAMAGALAIGGVAYANGGGDSGDGEAVVRIETTEDGQSGATERDCPEKDGGAAEAPETNL